MFEIERVSFRSPRIWEDVHDGVRLLFRVVREGRPQALKPLIGDEVCQIGRAALLNAARHSEVTRVDPRCEYHDRTAHSDS